MNNCGGMVQSWASWLPKQNPFLCVKIVAVRDLSTLLILMLTLNFFACGEKDKHDISDYYFPVKNLKGGKVYEYTVSQNDSVVPEYWYYRAFVRDSGLFLVGTYYDHQFQIGQIIREKITKTGALAKECNFYEADPRPNVEGGQIRTQTRIEAPNKFPFLVSDSLGVFLFKLQFNPPEEPDLTFSVLRKRRYLGKAPDFEFDGKKHACVKFSLHETIGNEQEEHDKVVSIGEEWYAKGLGLVYYRKTYGGGAFKIESRLTDIFHMKELERKAAEHYGE